MYKETTGVSCRSQPWSAKLPTDLWAWSIVCLGCENTALRVLPLTKELHCRESAKPRCVASSHFTWLLVVLKLEKQEN